MSRIPCPVAHTNDAQKLGEELSRGVSKQSALTCKGVRGGDQSCSMGLTAAL